MGWDALLDVGSKEEDWLPAIDFLVREGYLEKHTHDVEITYKGKSFIEQGGFVGQHRRERLLLYCGVVAALCGFLGLLLSVVALLR